MPGVTMLAAPIPADETARLQALHDLALLDTAREERFDRYVRLARALVGAPIAIISLMDANRQWFKGCEGLDVSGTPRDVSFCGHALLSHGVFYISDARADARFADNPLVTGEPHIRFYAGCPLFVHGTHAVGTLCVIDREPRRLDQPALLRLRDLADCLQREFTVQMLMRDIQRSRDAALMAGDAYKALAAAG